MFNVGDVVRLNPKIKNRDWKVMEWVGSVRGHIEPVGFFNREGDRDFTVKRVIVQWPGDRLWQEAEEDLLVTLCRKN